MKNILLFMAIIVTMAACQNKEDFSSVPIVPVYNNSALSDTAKADETMELVFANSQPKQATVKRTSRTAVHRTRTSGTTYQPAVETSPAVTPVPTSPGV